MLSREMPVWTKEFMDNWVTDRQEGSQCTADDKVYTQPEDHPPIEGRKAFTEGNHYIIRGCNIHDKSEWVRYLFEDAT